MFKPGFVYVMSAPDKTALYTGVTSELTSRIWQHRSKHFPDSFSARYNCVVLVYYQYFDSIETAIAEEKRIKGGSRLKKEKLINSMNPGWRDLWEGTV